MFAAQDALELEVKQFPEYGLRLILTFCPSTNFLVPLDRCIHLARQAFTTNSRLLMFESHVQRACNMHGCWLVAAPLPLHGSFHYSLLEAASRASD